MGSLVPLPKLRLLEERFAKASNLRSAMATVIYKYTEYKSLKLFWFQLRVVTV